MTVNTDGLNTFLMSTGVLTLSSLAFAWYEKNNKSRVEQKLREKVLSSPATSWRKVGRVRQLFCYPLKSGKAKSIDECFFSEYGMTIDGGVRLIEDRMFIAFDDKTRKFVTGRSHPKLLLVKCSFVNENRAIFEADGMPVLEFNLPDYKSKPAPFIMWFGENVNGIDCGIEASKWLSKYLNESECGIKLAVRIPEKHRQVTKDPAWKPFAKVYDSMRDEDSGHFADLASYMLLSKESVDDLNNRIKKPIQPLQLRPNLVVEDCNEPYAEDKWQWIKIGDEAIIRNFKLCTRCTMTRVDPETGIPDPTYEPLKTLRTYRKIKDPALDELELHAPALGVYCGLYRPGMVRLNDHVYVYQDNE